MEAVMYLVMGPRDTAAQAERVGENWTEAARAAWRWAMRRGTNAVVVDDRIGNAGGVIVGRTKRFPNRLQLHEPTIVFEDLREQVSA